MAITDSPTYTPPPFNQTLNENPWSEWWGDFFNPPSEPQDDQYIYDPWEGDPFDPYAELEESAELGTGISEYWQGLIGDPTWEDIKGGFEEYAHLFTPWEESRFVDRPEWFVGEAVEDVADYTTVWDLLQEQELDTYELGIGADLDVWELLQEQAPEEWALLTEGYAADIQGLENLWELRKDEFEALGLEKEDIWALQETSLGRQITESEDIFALKAAELERLGIAAGDLWTLSQNDLAALGIDASDIWAIERAAIERLQLEKTDIWGMQEAGYFREGEQAIDIFNLQAADIARRKMEAGTMWGLQSTAFQEGWATEKEQLTFTTQTGLRQAGQAQSQAIFASGMATAPTGLQDMQKDIRTQYGMQLSAGEEQLSNQLQIGAEGLTQTLAGLQADLNMGQEELQNTLTDLSAARDISEAAYNSEIANLATQLNIGEEDLINLLESYDRDLIEGEFALDQQLEGYIAQGLIDDVQAESIRAALQDSIDIGSADLANVLAGLTRTEKYELEAHGIAIERIVQNIAEGELTLEQALETGQLNYNSAVASGLLTYQQALDMGATAYEINVGNVYDDLQENIWNVMDQWMAEQNDILSGILTGDVFDPGSGTTGGTEGEFSSKYTDNQWSSGDIAYEIDPIHGYYTYWEMGADGEWFFAGQGEEGDELSEGALEMPEGAFVIECSAYDDDC